MPRWHATIAHPDSATLFCFSGWRVYTLLGAVFLVLPEKQRKKEREKEGERRRGRDCRDYVRLYISVPEMGAYNAIYTIT